MLVANTGFAQSTENQQIVFEGSLTDASGNAIDLSSAGLTFYISANGCYLYGESSSSSGDSSGNIIHRIGSGVQVPGSPNSFSQNLFFGNVNGTTTFAGNNCSVNASHTRLAQVYYPAQSITATIKLGTVPYAHNAATLDGKNAADFLQVTTDSNTLFYSGSAGQFLTKTASGLTWTNSSVTSSTIASALGYTPVSTSSIASLTLRSNNLSDLTSATIARNNLGLGNLAVKNSVVLGTAEVTGSLPASALPSFSGDVSTAAGSSTTTIQSLRGIALSNTAPVSGQVLFYNGINWGPVTIPNSIGTVTNVASTNSDIVVISGTSTPMLTLNVGTGPSQIIRLDASSRLPAVNGIQLTSLNATNVTSGQLPVSVLPSFSGDVSIAAGSSTTTIQSLRGVALSNTAPVSGQVLFYNGINWGPMAIPNSIGTVTNVASTNGDIVVVSGSSTPTLTLNTGTGPSQIVRLDSISRLPAVNGIQLTSLNATNVTSGQLPVSVLPPFSGDANSISGTSVLTVTRLRGISISSATPTVNQVLAYNAGQWIPTTFSAGAMSSITAGDGLLGGMITASGVISVNFGTSFGTVAAGDDSRFNNNLKSFNNLADVASVSATHANLGLGAMATKSTVNLATDVAGVLPVQNGGSPWVSVVNGFYIVSNTAIGTATVTPTTKLYVEGNTVGQVMKINNTNSAGYGLKIDVAGNNPNFYALNVNNSNGSMFMVQNDGLIGIGTMAPSARIHIASGSNTVAPIKFSTGSLLSTPASGALEYDGANLYITDSTNTRRIIAAGGLGSLDNIQNVNSSMNVSLNPSIGGSVFVSSTAISTSPSTGALVVKGGLGVSGTIRAGGDVYANSVLTQAVFGGLLANQNLILESTANAIRGNILLAPSGGNVGIGTSGTPAARLSVEGNGTPGIQIKKTGAAATDTFNMINDMDSSGYFWLAIGSNGSSAPTTANRLLGISNEGNFEFYGQAVNTGTDKSEIISLKTQAAATGGTKNEASIGFYADRTDLNNQSGFIGYESGTTLDLSIMNNKGSLHLGTSGTAKISVLSNGNIGIGTLAPTARLHLASGSTTLAPLKLTSGSLLSTPVAGSIEYNGSKLLITDGTNTRRSVVTGNSPNSIDGINFINSSGDIDFNTSGTVYLGFTVIGSASGPNAIFNVISNTAGSELIRYDGGTNGYYARYATNGVIRASEGLLNGSGSFFTNGEINNAYFVHAEHAIQMGVGPSLVMTLSASGNIGVGTKTPESKLHLVTTGSANSLSDDLFNDSYNNINSNPGWLTRRARGTQAAPLAAQPGDGLGLYQGYGYSSGGNFVGAAKISFQATSDFSVSQTANMTFSTANGSGLNEVMRITENGKVGIGTASPTATLTVSGAIRTTAGVEFADGTTQQSAAFSSYERVQANCGSTSTCMVTCPVPKKVLSGGCSNAGSAPLTGSYAPSDTQYSCTYASGVLTNVIAYAICTKF